MCLMSKVVLLVIEKNFMFMIKNIKWQKVQITQNKNLRETWNSKIDEQCMKTQIRDQSNRVRTNKSFDWSKVLSLSSKVWLHSFQTNHIKQAGTMFQISEPYLQNQFLQLNSKKATFPGKTHWITNIYPLSISNITMD